MLNGFAAWAAAWLEAVAVWADAVCTPDHCNYFGGTLAVILGLAYCIKCAFRWHPPKLNFLVEILVYSLSIGAGARIASLIHLISVPPIGYEERFFFGVGAVALIWVSVEAIVRVFCEREH